MNGSPAAPSPDPRLAPVTDLMEELGLFAEPLQLWLVVGTQGNYSDRREWNVAAYFSKELALNHIAECEKMENALRTAWLAAVEDRASYEWRGGAMSSYESPEERARWANPFDPSLHVNDFYGGGITWFCSKVELRGALPDRPSPP